MDVVATSEVSISLTLDPSKLWSRELIQQASVWFPDPFEHNFNQSSLSNFLNYSVCAWTCLDQLVIYIYFHQLHAHYLCLVFYAAFMSVALSPMLQSNVTGISFWAGAWSCGGRTRENSCGESPSTQINHLTHWECTEVITYTREGSVSPLADTMCEFDDANCARACPWFLHNLKWPWV